MDPFTLVDAMRSLSMADVEGLAEQEAEALVIACERAVTAIQARGSLAMDTLADRVQQRLDAEEEEFAAATDSSRTWMSSSHQVVPSMLAPALRVATRTVLSRLEADRFLVNTMGPTFEAMWAGDLERHRADAVTECGRGLSSEALERYERLVLESSVDEVTGEVVTMSDRVKDLPRAALRRRAAKIARELEPEVTRAWAQEAHDSRRVIVRGAADPGMTRWDAVLPADVSQKMWAAVDALAASYCRANAGLKVDAARADALADLVLGNSTITTTVELVVPAVPLATVLARAPGPWSAEPAPGGAPPNPSAGMPLVAGTPGAGVTWIIAGTVEHAKIGALLPEAIADLLADPAVLVRLARLDADGTIAQDPRPYRPGATLRRRVMTRDRTCRFPGCQTPAARTDLDHVIPFPTGPTDETNLVCLCRTHHLFKQHGGWRARLGLDGTLCWTAPDGRAYRTRPGIDQLCDEMGVQPGAGQSRADSEPETHPPLAQMLADELRQPPIPPESLASPDAPPDWESLDAPAPVGHHEAGEGSALEATLAEVVSITVARRQRSARVEILIAGHDNAESG